MHSSYLKQPSLRDCIGDFSVFHHCQCIDQGNLPDFQVAFRIFQFLLAKAHCADVFLAVAGEGIQIHGGLGFTWEQDLHLYFKRAKADEMALGDPTWCREQVARLVIDEGAPAP